MRYIRYSVLGLIAVSLITIALANRDPLTVRLLPDELAGLIGVSFEVTLPAFAIMLITVVVGAFLGFVWEWVREHKHRVDAAVNRRERQLLEEKFSNTLNTKNEKDDVLALLEGQ